MDITDIIERQQMNDKIMELLQKMRKIEACIFEVSKDGYKNNCVDLYEDDAGVYIYDSTLDFLCLSLPEFEIVYESPDIMYKPYFRNTDKTEHYFTNTYVNIIEQLEKAYELYLNYCSKWLLGDIVFRKYRSLWVALHKGERAGLLATIYINPDSPNIFKFQVNDKSYECNEFTDEAIDWFCHMVDKELQHRNS